MGAANPLAPQVRLELPVKLLPILEPKRFKVMHGGRGGAKSHTVAQVLLMLSQQRKIRILCVREVQKSLKDSVWQLLLDYMDRQGVRHLYDVVKSESRITCLLTGSTFAFTGLKDHTADSIKSFEGVDIVWVEEAHSVTARSWNILIPTIRKAGSEIWITFNPDQKTDYVYDRFIAHSDPKAWVCEINWRDNPWFGAEMNDERRTLKALNDDLYQHVWEGKCRSDAGLLFKRAWFKRYPLGKHPETLNRYVASDYAAGPDPDKPDSEPDWTEHGCVGLDPDGDMWFVDWWSGQTDPHVWIQAWLAMLRHNKPVLAAFEEKGVILRSQDAAINKAMRESDTFVARIGLASAGNKAARALGFAARCAAGTVWIPECEWGDRLINQLCAFNGQEGRTDDMVDVCSLAARGLDDMADARPAKPVRPEPPKAFTERWFAERDKDHRGDVPDARTYR
jgi:predicted phage terminase large subunit-like protein